MKLWEKTKRLFDNRKAKRVKKQERPISADMTTAERLIMNNWGIRFDFTEPARAGEQRAAKRLAAKHKANKSIPDNKGEISRQVRRQVERREFKALRAMVRDERSKNKRNARQIEQDLIPT